jgi:ABC-type antimicrobial peptide transport system permease subunit
MFDQLKFYIKHSLNDMRVNGQRTLFALLCIASGVAAIVSLQTLGVMIDNTLTTSLQEANQADIRIEAALDEFELTDEQVREAGSDGLITPSEQFDDYFNAEGLETLRAWFEENFPGEVETTYRQGLPLTSGISSERAGTATPFVVSFVVDTGVFPLYGDIQTLDGRSLAEAIEEPTDMVVSETLADDMNLEIGDVLSIGGATAKFNLVGIIEESGGTVGQDFFASIVGFYFIDHDAIQFFADIEGTRATTVYTRLADPAREIEINEALLEEYPYLDTTTTADLRDLNETLSGGINDLVSVMGLLSMLIGGIGIINTMQVIVRRRTVEVAVLKTIGLRGRQVTNLFLVEAFLMGVVGSIAGVILGWTLTFALRSVAENVFGSLPFVFALEPVIIGLIVGILVTTVFGFLPTLSAGQIRPGLVLRPEEALVPRAGWLQSLLALLVVIVAIALIGFGFIGPIAFLVVPAAFLTMGILYLLLSLVIWVVGRFFPSFGIVDLKVSLRSMLAARGRVASTLLALVIGVFVLSVVTLLSGTILRQFQQLIELDVGGNVIVAGLASDQSTLDRIETTLDGADGVESYSALAQYGVRLQTVEKPAGNVLTYEEIEARVNELGPLNPGAAPPQDEEEGSTTSDFLQFSFGSLDAREIGDNLPELPFYAGRQLNQSDAGENHIVISRDNFSGNAGIEVGDQLTFSFENSRLAAFGLSDENAPTRTYEVVGIIDRTSAIGTAGFTSPMYAPIDALPDSVAPSTVSAIVQVDEDAISDVRSELQEIPGVLVAETRLLNDLVNSLVEQFTSLPILVAALSLLVGGIVIANSVALTTMERRREIAVMKAVGLQRERVLGMLLLENGLMGLIGGVIGVGIGLILLLTLLDTIFPGLDTAGSVPYGTAVLLMLLCVVIAVIAAMLSSWNASGEKPLNVLRYE